MNKLLVATVAAFACSHAPAAQEPQPAPPQPAVAQAPAAPLAPVDAVSPITAAGREEPRGLDWPPERLAQRSADAFKNVKVLGDVHAGRFMAAMQSMQANLGQKCGLCHLVQEKDFASDKKEEKQRAREMIQMTNRIDATTFGGEPKVTCWMCHRGEEKPARDDRPPPEVAPWFPKISEQDAQKPAGQVFKNMKVLAQAPAGRVGVIMSMLSRSLGVKCTHCHVENDFASDAKKEKQFARTMFELTRMVATTYYAEPSKSQVSCWTCHRGQATPQRVQSVAAAQ